MRVRGIIFSFALLICQSQSQSDSGSPGSPSSTSLLQPSQSANPCSTNIIIDNTLPTSFLNTLQMLLESNLGGSSCFNIPNSFDQTCYNSPNFPNFNFPSPALCGRNIPPNFGQNVSPFNNIFSPGSPNINPPFSIPLGQNPTVIPPSFGRGFNSGFSQVSPPTGPTQYEAEVIFPSSIPAQLVCNFAYVPATVPVVAVNVETLGPYDPLGAITNLPGSLPVFGNNYC